MGGLTGIKDKVSNFYYKHRRMPSYSELADIASFKSKNAAYKLADKLLDDGFLRRDVTGRLLPGSLDLLRNLIIRNYRYRRLS